MSSADSKLRDLQESSLASDHDQIRSQMDGRGTTSLKGIPIIIPDLKPQGAFSAASEPRRAFLTMLAGNYDEAVFGVVGLAKGLKKVMSKYALVVAFLADMSEEHCKLLASNGCIVKRIEPVFRAPYGTNYSKLRIWEFEEYDKMIYLDGNVQVFKNIDHMFDYPDSYFYAALDCFCDKSWSRNPQHKIGYCQQWPNKAQWDPTSGPKPPLYFNADMFVFEPSVATYGDLVKTLQTSPTTAFAEQDLLNEFFKDKLVALAPHYNLMVPMLWRHPEAVELDRVKVVNYCANGSKPWSYTGKEENMEREDVKMLVDKWWEIYDDDSLDYMKTLTSAKVGRGTGQVNLQPVTSIKAGKGTDQVNLQPSEAGFPETGADEFTFASFAA
ncbi:galactinol synthase 2-like [Pyrus x bretschneideri]|uniref:galactinol synthase 2-like n=1 Tax=Pyrus x bretschneideri TaxID=225117 RepID=UPI002030CD13|nr:galactinol synthase 2-like [Pyrus x bretschneideri]